MHEKPSIGIYQTVLTEPRKKNLKQQSINKSIRIAMVILSHDIFFFFFLLETILVALIT